MTLYLLYGGGGLVLLYIVLTFNRLTKKKNLAAEGWSGIDVQLKKRYDLVPNLVTTVKAYARHEQETLENITRLRQQGMQAGTITDQGMIAGLMTQSLHRLFAVVENYPELMADTNFRHLQQELSNIENTLQMARRYYNATVRDLNILVESFPSNLIASLFGFQKREFFRLDDASQAQVQSIDFS
jgi:LemA protein